MIEFIEYKLKDLISQKITGEWGSEPKNKSEGVFVLRTTNFTNIGKLNFRKVVKRVIDKTKIDKKKLKIGDIIIEKSGGSFKQPVGRVVFFEKEDGVYLCNNFTTILRPNELIYPKYLLYQLHYNHKIGKTLKFQNQTTGIINLKLDKYLNSKVKIPKNINKQREIANILTQIETLIFKREESIQLLDELLWSAFENIFKEHNNLDYKLEELCSEIVDCPHSTPKYSNKKTKFSCLRTSEFSNGYIDESSMKHLNKEEYLKRIKRLTPQFGDVIYAREGSYGDAVRVPKNSLICLGQRTMLFRPKIELCNSVFLWALVRSDIVFRQAKKKNKGATVGRVNVKDIKNFKVFLPPKELQEKFKKIVEEIEITKIKYQKSLLELNELFDSLSQKAFKCKSLQKETKIYELDLTHVEKVSIKSSPKENLETYILDLFQSNIFIIEDIQHLFETDFTYSEIKEKIFEMLEEKKIKHTLEEYATITERFGEKIKHKNKQVKLVVSS